MLAFFDVKKHSLLQFVLFRECLDAVWVLCVLHFTVIFGADVVSFGSPNVSFGMPVASTLAPCGIIERSRRTWEHKKGDFAVQAWTSPGFGWVSVQHFDSS